MTLTPTQFKFTRNLQNLCVPRHLSLVINTSFFVDPVLWHFNFFHSFSRIPLSSILFSRCLCCVTVPLCIRPFTVFVGHLYFVSYFCIPRICWWLGWNTYLVFLSAFHSQVFFREEKSFWQRNFWEIKEEYMDMIISLTLAKYAIDD